MTLVVTCLTRDYVMQASDRRMTWIDRAGARTYDDETSKVVLYCGHFALAYTGIGNLGPRQATDDWLACQLGRGRNIGEAVEAVRAAAGPAFASIRADPSLKRHTFVAAGWARFGSEEAPFEPCAFLISNFETGGVQLPAPDRDFHLELHRLPRNGDTIGVVFVSGQSITDEDVAALRADMARNIEWNRGLQDMAELLGGLIRKTARSNQAVGRGIMIATVPRKALDLPPGDQLVAVQHLVDERASFFYVPSDDRSNVVLGPQMICGPEPAVPS